MCDSVIFGMRPPLDTEDIPEDEYYCGVDTVYRPEEDEAKHEIEAKKIVDSVCNIKDGTSFCTDVNSFTQFYSQPPVVCDNSGCHNKPELTQQQILTVYRNFVQFYGDIRFYKLKNDIDISVYITKVHSNLMIDNQYLFAMVNIDNEDLGTKKLLSQLQWISFQCRKLNKGYNIEPERLANNVNDMMLGKIEQEKLERSYAQYKCETLPITIYLLHKKAGVAQYNPTAKLYLALNQFDTIVTY